MKSLYTFIISAVLLISACTNGVELSDDPGYLKVYFQASPADTLITLINTSYVLSNNDDLTISINEGKAYDDKRFFILYSSLETFSEMDVRFNILDNDTPGNPKQNQVFESYLPTGNYTNLELYLNSDNLRIQQINIPLVTANGLPIQINKYAPFQISPGDTTHIYLQLNVVESLSRYRDTFRFAGLTEIIRID